MQYWVYMVRCADDTLYTGITDNLERRIKTHKYTRGRGPVVLVYQEACADKPEALRRELAIKQMSRREKLCLLEAPEA